MGKNLNIVGCGQLLTTYILNILKNVKIEFKPHLVCVNFLEDESLNFDRSRVRQWPRASFSQKKAG